MKVLAGLIYDVELEAVWDTECSALLDKLLMALPVEWDDQLIEILPLLEVGLAELALAFLRFKSTQVVEPLAQKEHGLLFRS